MTKRSSQLLSLGVASTVTSGDLHELASSAGKSTARQVEGKYMCVGGVRWWLPRRICSGTRESAARATLREHESEWDGLVGTDDTLVSSIRKVSAARVAVTRERAFRVCKIQRKRLNGLRVMN